MKTFLGFLSSNWPWIASVLTAILVAIATALTKDAKHPRGQAVGRFLLGFFSAVEHADVGGLKFPFWPAKWPPPIDVQSAIKAGDKRDPPSTPSASGGAGA